MIYRNIDGRLYDIDPDRITMHRGEDCVRIEGWKSVPPEFLKIVQPIKLFVLWKEATELWESL